MQIFALLPVRGEWKIVHLMASPFVRTEQTEFFVCSDELDAYTRAGKLKNMAHVTLIFVTKKLSWRMRGWLIFNKAPELKEKNA